MARSIDLTSRIDGLERALLRAKELPKDERLSSTAMSQLAGVTWVSLREWCDSVPDFDGKNCFTRGGQGIAWEFDAVKTITVLLGHFKSQRDRRTARNREVAKNVGLEQNDEMPADLNELAKQVSLTITLTEAKEKQRAYIPAALFADFMSGYNTAAVEAVLGIKAQVDSTGSLQPEISALIDEHLRNVAVAMSRRAQAFIKDFDARLVESGDSRNS